MIEWKNETTTWIFIKDVKEVSPIELASWWSIIRLLFAIKPEEKE